MTEIIGVDLMFLEHGEIEKDGRNRSAKHSVSSSSCRVNNGDWERS